MSRPEASHADDEETQSRRGSLMTKGTASGDEIRPLEQRAINTALAGLSTQTRRVYSAHITRWLEWRKGQPLDREGVKAYIRMLELAGSSPQVRNQALAALKKLAGEAGEMGWIPAPVATRIDSIKSRKISGVRTGRWLTVEQTAQLLAAPDRAKAPGKRDACALALLVGCGLRRTEACDLDVEQLKETAGRTIIMNLVGKGGRVRSIGAPAWARTLIMEWVEQLKSKESK